MEGGFNNVFERIRIIYKEYFFIIVMLYPYIAIDLTNELELDMKPPRGFKNLTCKINSSFKTNFEKRAKQILENFNVGGSPIFSWDDEGLHSLSIFPQYGFWLEGFEKGFKYKNVKNSKDAIAFLNIISVYYQALNSLNEKRV